jgi:C1A family cysteine protease
VDNPKWSTYKGEVFRGSSSGPITWANFDSSGIDHDVVIVGWDDAAGGAPADDPKGAWIIKNSWGPKWGREGFMLLAYDTANIGFNAAAIDARPAKMTISAQLKSKLDAIQRKKDAFQ